MLLLFLALASAPALDPPKPIFSYQDYPAEALRNRWQGSVVADLTISAEGRPTACRIVKSSGHKVLDDVTCKLIMTRARFTPAKDQTGKPKESTLRTPVIEWRIQ